MKRETEKEYDLSGDIFLPPENFPLFKIQQRSFPSRISFWQLSLALEGPSASATFSALPHYALCLYLTPAPTLDPQLLDYQGDPSSLIVFPVKS